MAQRLLVHQSPSHSQQNSEEQTLSCHGKSVKIQSNSWNQIFILIRVFLCTSDASHIQIGADVQEGAARKASHASVLRSQAHKDADAQHGSQLAQVEHEHHIGHLSKDSPPHQRRLGVWQRAGGASVGLSVRRKRAAWQDRLLQPAHVQNKRCVVSNC